MMEYNTRIFEKTIDQKSLTDYIFEQAMNVPSDLHTTEITTVIFNPQALAILAEMKRVKKALPPRGLAEDMEAEIERMEDRVTRSATIEQEIETRDKTFPEAKEEVIVPEKVEANRPWFDIVTELTGKKLSADLAKKDKNPIEQGLAQIDEIEEEVNKDVRVVDSTLEKIRAAARRPFETETKEPEVIAVPEEPTEVETKEPEVILVEEEPTEIEAKEPEVIPLEVETVTIEPEFDYLDMPVPNGFTLEDIAEAVKDLSNVKITAKQIYDANPREFNSNIGVLAAEKGVVLSPDDISQREELREELFHKLKPEDIADKTLKIPIPKVKNQQHVHGFTPY